MQEFLANMQITGHQLVIQYSLQPALHTCDVRISRVFSAVSPFLSASPDGYSCFLAMLMMWSHRSWSMNPGHRYALQGNERQMGPQIDTRPRETCKQLVVWVAGKAH